MVKRTLPGSRAATGALGLRHPFRPEPPVTDSPRPQSRETENENQRTPAHDGEAPRPATEPGGAGSSSNSGDTATDPATGAPNP
jgi:hypothetical protein